MRRRSDERPYHPTTYTYVRQFVRGRLVRRRRRRGRALSDRQYRANQSHSNWIVVHVRKKELLAVEKLLKRLRRTKA